MTTRVPGQWPDDLRTTTVPAGTMPEPMPRPAPTPPVTDVVPAVRLQAVIDLSGPHLQTARDVDNALWEQARYSLTGAHVRVILGDAALMSLGLARQLAGLTLGATGVDIEVAPGVDRGPLVRIFTASLIQECRLVLADHHATCREAGWRPDGSVTSQRTG